MKNFIFLAAFISLAGCASSAAEYNEGAGRVPSSRLYGFTDKSDAQLVVVHGAAVRDICTIRFFIDGKPGADLTAGEVAYLSVTVGSHRLSMRPLEGCANSRADHVNVQLKAGDALISRIDETGFRPGLK
jgi:hypothetical protein